MYLAFFFYVFLLIVRYMENFSKQPVLNFHRVLHATIASVAVWLIIFCIIFPPTLLKYGFSANNSTQCFHFGEALKKSAVKNLNYVICIVVLLVWSGLVCFQLYFLLYVGKTHGTCDRQEFQVQMKNLVFLLVMFLCFVPYQVFRIYYVSAYRNSELLKSTELPYKNEIFLALTAFSCLDMIVFSGRNIYKYLSSRGCMCCF